VCAQKFSVAALVVVLVVVGCLGRRERHFGFKGKVFAGHLGREMIMIKINLIGLGGQSEIGILAESAEHVQQGGNRQKKHSASSDI
jgi:hypothetical protein